MLLRGMNLVAYRNFPDDVVEEFIRLSRKNGIDNFRIFDALNDLRNLEVPIKAVKNTVDMPRVLCHTRKVLFTQ